MTTPYPFNYNSLTEPIFLNPSTIKKTAETPGDYGSLPKIKGMKKKLLEGK